MGAKDTVHFSARVPRSLARDLADIADRLGTSVSGAAVRLLEEGVRMSRHPGIDFRPTLSGRRAFVTGTGLAVWEVDWLWRAHGRATKKLLEAYPHLTPSQVAAATAYADAYTEEIARERRLAQPPRSKVPFPRFRA
jgi:uncharacterized protein (DUF433 family)